MALRIEEGKFYRARNGRKVGPFEYVNRGQTEIRFHWRAPQSDGGPWLWAHDGTFGENRNKDWDLTAEWTEEPTGPVRAVTRKEIVPGIYGRLKITETQREGTYGDVCIQLVNRAGLIHGSRDPDPALMTVAELRAAAITFNELADALDSPSLTESGRTV